MQYALRPYATAGVALVGASMIAVTPIAVPLPQVQARSVQLVDAWSELIGDTTQNLALISQNADPAAITGVFQALLTNPLGVIQALTNLTPTVDASIGTLPATVNVELPPGLELGIAQLGAWATTLESVNDVIGQLSSNPAGAFTTLLDAPATILNGFLNGEDNISLLGGLVNIAGFNGVLAPLQDVSVNLNLSGLIDALGLGNIDLTSLDLSTLLGITNLGGLFDALNLDDTTLGSLLGDLPLGTLLNDFGLTGLSLPSISLDSILDAFGLNFGDIDLTSVLDAFGLNTSLPVLGDSLTEALTDSGLLNGVVSSLNTTISTILNGFLLGPLLNPLLSALTDPANLISALDNVTVGQLFGITGGGDTVGDLLGALGVHLPTTLNIADVLEGLGVPSSFGGLDLGGLLDGLNLDTLGLGSALDTLSVGSLLGDLGLSGIPLDLSSLTDGLNLGDLLSSLDLGNLASINIDGFGGMASLLTDLIPQQILASLGG